MIFETADRHLAKHQLFGEVIDGAEQTGCFFCDTVGFKKVKFELGKEPLITMSRPEWGLYPQNFRPRIYWGARAIITSGVVDLLPDRHRDGLGRGKCGASCMGHRGAGRGLVQPGSHLGRGTGRIPVFSCRGERLCRSYTRRSVSDRGFPPGTSYGGAHIQPFGMKEGSE